MPYKSSAQRRKFHAAEERGEISPSTVKEFDAASKGKKLPPMVGKKRPATKNEAREYFYNKRGLRLD